MAKITFAALDGSLRNFGIAKLQYDTETETLTPIDLILVKTEKSKDKKVRSSSDNLARATALAQGLAKELKDAVMVFAEVPSGGQDYKAVLGFGIVIGLYASIRVPVVEVSPSETKLAAVGSKNAAKQEMIDWATATFPDAPWRTTKRNGQLNYTADNEHLADAVAIGMAGIKTPAFQQMLAILNSTLAAA